MCNMTERKGKGKLLEETNNLKGAKTIILPTADAYLIPSTVLGSALHWSNLRNRARSKR